MDSRTETTRLLGRAIGRLSHPPRLWMNASTATIYRHIYDRPMDEQTGEVGGHEPDAPAKWRFSIDLATRWEAASFEAQTLNVRKVALRSAMVMSPDRGGIFDALLRLVMFGSTSRFDFEAFLKNRGIYDHAYSVEDLAEDVENLRRLERPL